MCKGLKAERAYYLGKTTSTVVTMAVSKGISGTAEREEVAEEIQIMKHLVHAAR